MQNKSRKQVSLFLNEEDFESVKAVGRGNFTAGIRHLIGRFQEDHPEEFSSLKQNRLDFKDFIGSRNTREGFGILSVSESDRPL